MTHVAEFIFDAVERLSDHDPTLGYVVLAGQQHTDAELAELADCLLAYPDFVTHVRLARNQLTDETGVKLARYLAASTSLEVLSLARNTFGEATYLALAAALRVNSSLRGLYLNDNQAVDRTRIDAAFIEALRLNPDRPGQSIWQLYSFSNDLMRLRTAACELGHPSLQLLLALLCSD